MTELKGRPVAFTPTAARARPPPSAWQTSAKTKGLEIDWIEKGRSASPAEKTGPSHAADADAEPGGGGLGQRGDVVRDRSFGDQRVALLCLGHQGRDRSGGGMSPGRDSGRTERLLAVQAVMHGGRLAAWRLSWTAPPAQASAPRAFNASMLAASPPVQIGAASRPWAGRSSRPVLTPAPWHQVSRRLSQCNRFRVTVGVWYAAREQKAGGCRASMDAERQGRAAVRIACAGRESPHAVRPATFATRDLPPDRQFAAWPTSAARWWR